PPASGPRRTCAGGRGRHAHVIARRLAGRRHDLIFPASIPPSLPPHREDVMKASRLLVGFAVVGLTLSHAAARADDAPIEVQVGDALNKAWGQHAGFRANHAKGMVVEGSFKATPAAAELSKAALFTGSAIPVTVRFSDSTGLPDLADGSPLANPHGM